MVTRLGNSCRQRTAAPLFCYTVCTREVSKVPFATISLQWFLCISLVMPMASPRCLLICWLGGFATCALSGRKQTVPAPWEDCCPASVVATRRSLHRPPRHLLLSQPHRSTATPFLPLDSLDRGSPITTPLLSTIHISPYASLISTTTTTTTIGVPPCTGCLRASTTQWSKSQFTGRYRQNNH